MSSRFPTRYSQDKSGCKASFVYLFSHMQKAAFLIIQLNFHTFYIRIVGLHCDATYCQNAGPRWLSGRASDSGARGPGFEPHRTAVCIVSLSKTL